MIKKKKTVALIASICSIIAATSGAALAFNAVAQSSYGDAFNYAHDVQMKYKSAYIDTSISNEKGMLFYAYDSGAKADFKGMMRDTFETTLVALAEEGKAADLGNYSLLFTDKETGASFSIGVVTGKNEANIYVQVNGEKAGIVYYRSQWSEPKAYGYTGLYNKENVYTVGPEITSEDFSRFTEKVPSVFFRLGIKNEEKGITTVAHQTDFTLDEDALEYGVKTFVRFVLDNQNGVDKEKIKEDK